MVIDLDKTSQTVQPILNGSSPVCKGLAKQLLEPSFTDWTLICEGEKILCHRVLLASQSPVFNRMFKSGFRETVTSQTKIVVKIKIVGVFSQKFRICYVEFEQYSDHPTTSSLDPKAG